MMQCILVVLFTGGVCWAAYSTGSYMAVQMAFKAQNQTLRSIANARVDANFHSLYPAAPILTGTETEENLALSLSSPVFTLSSMDSDKLLTRVAFLEQRVAQLQETNTNIIQRVRDKTGGRIGEIETIIKQAGLNPNSLKKELSNNTKEEPSIPTAKDSKSQGGPFIPADTLSAMSPDEQQLYASLDELALLERISDMLPFAYPMKNPEEQSRFGHRIDPFSGRLALHAGIDLTGPAGTKVLSAGEGKVVTAEYSRSYGNMVDIDHGFGVTTRYGHMSKLLVKEGQTVKRGQPIGVQGSTGRSTGPHLHYEVRIKDRPVNPKKFLKVAHNVSKE